VAASISPTPDVLQDVVSWRLKSCVVSSHPLSLSCPNTDALQERRVLALKIVVIVSLVAASSTESLASFFVYSSKYSEHVHSTLHKSREPPIPRWVDMQTLHARALQARLSTSRSADHPDPICCDSGPGGSLMASDSFPTGQFRS